MRTKFLLTFFLATLAGCADYNSPELTQFEITEDTVLDKNTKLMWASNDNKINLNRHEALDYCKSYSGGGFDDWRMPTVAELKGIMGSNVEGKVRCSHSAAVWSGPLKPMTQKEHSATLNPRAVPGWNR